MQTDKEMKKFISFKSIIYKIFYSTDGNNLSPNKNNRTLEKNKKTTGIKYIFSIFYGINNKNCRRNHTERSWTIGA